MLLVSGDGYIRAANPRAYEIAGLDDRDLTGRRLSDLVVDPPEKVADYLKICSRNREAVFGSLAFAARDDEVIECRMEGAVVRPWSESAPAQVWLRLKPKQAAASGFTLLNEKIDQLIREIAERKLMAARLREQTEAVETVNRIGRVLTAEMDLQKLVQAVTDAATELTGARFGSFFYNVINQEGESYMLYTLSGVPREAFEHFPMPRATDLFGPTFRGEGTIRIDNVKEDPRYGKNSPYYGMPPGHLPVTSYLAVPVISRSGEVIGGLFFGHPKVGIFTEHQERIVEGLAAQTAVAMDNARLLESAQRDRRQAEASERHYRFLAEAIPQIVWTAQPDGSLDYYNDQWYKYTGMTFEETRGWGWQPVLHPEDLPICLDAWTRSLETGQAYEIEYRFKRASDGAYRWHLGRALPLRDREGKIVKWFGTCTDIDDQKRSEQSLRFLAEENERLYHKAQEASHAKDEFLATVSHELRTPLNAILGWSQVMQRGRLDQASQARALETIERNSKLQAQLINDILDVSRIITGKLRLDLRPVELASVIQAAVETVRPTADARNVRLQIILDNGPGSVLGDPDRLQQIIWNLLSNAIKFTPARGSVLTQLARVDSHMEITVSDTGRGIHPDFLPHVFERFRQADSTSSRTHGGLGLGLAIVRHLVEAHGGTVQAESAGDGLGATFTVKLPLMAGYVKQESVQYSSLAGEPDTVTQPVPALDGLRILVVDDEPEAQRVLAMMLQPLGAEIKTCNSADEALEEVPRFKPDVIVSDIGMPGEDGYSLIRKVRARSADEGGRIPAIALTAYARSEDRIRALAAGFQAHVPKPVDLTELALAIASLVGRTGSS